MTTNGRSTTETSLADGLARRKRGWRRVIIASGIFLAIGIIVFLSHGSPYTLVPGTPLLERPGLNDTGRRIQVSVLNGSGTPGIAMRMTEHLRSLGYDVVEVGNYGGGPLDRSLVIEWSGGQGFSEKIADAVSIPPSRIIRKKGPAASVDVTIVLGKDFHQLIPLRSGKAAPARGRTEGGHLSFFNT